MRQGVPIRVSLSSQVQDRMLPRYGADMPGSPERSVELSAHDFDKHIRSHNQAAINSPEILATRRAVYFEHRKHIETVVDGSDSGSQ